MIMPQFLCSVSTYPTEVQLTKANVSDVGTSFLDINIKIIGNDDHTSVYDNAMTSDFLSPIFPWLIGDVPRLLSYGIHISQLVKFC